MKTLVYVTIILLLTACGNNLKSVTITPNISQNYLTRDYKPANPQNISFKYVIDTSYSQMNGRIIELECELINHNYDTVYFFTHSCFGWQNNFLVDTSEVEVYQNIKCNVSNPIIKKIAPRTSFKFKGHFFLRSKKRKNIVVQYYIYRVDPTFDIGNIELIRRLRKTIIKKF